MFPTAEPPLFPTAEPPLFPTAEPLLFAVAAHSFAEVYSTLTRGGGVAPFGFSPDEAAAAPQSLRAAVQLVGLTPAQTFGTVRSFAANGGVGPRLCDALIDQCAAMQGIPAIVTWNTRHMAGLFGQLSVATPPAFLATIARQPATRPRA